MLHFSIGVLLYLAVGAVAAPAFQARDEPTSVVADDAAASSVQSPDPSSAQSSPSSSAPSSAPASVQSSVATSAQSDLSQSTGNGDPSSAGSSSQSPTPSEPAASDLSLGTSSSGESGIPKVYNQTLLYGPDLRPNITHLAPRCHGRFRELATGSSGVPEKVPTDDENKNLAEVRIHTLNDDGSVSRVNITVDKSNLANITSYGIETKNIAADKPWWPWALIEAGLQAGWVPKSKGTEEDYNVQDLLKIFTGVNVKDVKPDDEFYDNVMKHVEYTPMFVREKETKVYSVIMEKPKDKTVLPLARPYLHSPRDQGLTKDFTIKDMNVVKGLYLEGLLALPAVEKLDEENKGDPAGSSESMSASTGAEASTGTEVAGAVSTVITSSLSESAGAGTTEGGSTQAQSTSESSVYSAPAESSGASSSPPATSAA